ncbi:hypothetical protein DRO02_07990 [archaeon]|nr:MetS family NSS transporter small subunit [candidate division WOR-3 bacterium]RLG62447.1 MAG: hypothetical protein DRO02_07990 [archaeon]RLG62466.1 MAG: hypothetical protein DRO21_07320 [archaeon]
MNPGAIVMLIVGCLILYGGLIFSILRMQR